MTPLDDEKEPLRRPDLAAEQAREDDRRRMLQNAAALIFIVALVCFGTWLIDRLSAYSRNLSCLQAHHRSCG